MVLDKNQDETIIVDVVLKTGPDGSKSSTLPASVMNNSILLGKRLVTNFVTELPYCYNGDVFVRICQEHGFDENWCEGLKQIIDLNSGYIHAGLLRGHFGVGWALCARLTDSLVAEKQASYAPKGRKLYILPDGKRFGGVYG